MPIPPRVRFQILERDCRTCQYCGRKAPEVILHVDHVHPRSAGGTNRNHNLITACRDCNLGKGKQLTNKRFDLAAELLWEFGAEEFIYCDPAITSLYGEPVV